MTPSRIYLATGGSRMSRANSTLRSACCRGPAYLMRCAPRQSVVRTLRSCSAPGFEEVESGGGLATEVRDICQANDIALIGPNCEGVWSIAARAILTFGSPPSATRCTTRRSRS